MDIIRSIEKMRNLSSSLRMQGKRIAFVPTMGALHQGHASLLDIARKNGDVVVMSIFVNPTQFGPAEDFSKYPRPFESDCEKAKMHQCDIVFAPESSEMYPKDYQTFVTVEEISKPLCGACRPGHFKGVATIVLKLFNIVQPNVAVFGQKDAQQVLVIRQMVKDLHVPVEIIAAPIIREGDGLAMSSRNVYLTSEERKGVPVILKGLREAQTAFSKGERQAKALRNIIIQTYEESQMIKIEYIEIVDIKTVTPVEVISSTTLIAIACRTTQSNTRLIDNIILGGIL
jgi:pantoate--beta-alanine ligase